MAIRRVAVPMAASSTAVGGNGTAMASQQLAPEKTVAATESTRRQLNNIPFVGGVWLKGIVVPPSPASASVAHGLQTIPQGYIITKSNASPTVWAPTADYTTRNIRFYNSSGASVTIDAWVF